jgi:hypothetical protein
METVIMLYVTIVLFALAAIFGVLILKNWLTSANTSRTVVYAHGLLAATAVVLLLVQVIRDPASGLTTSIILFVIAALGGFFMFFRDLKGKFSPIWLAIVHGLVAVAGFVFLLLTVL